MVGKEKQRLVRNGKNPLRKRYVREIRRDFPKYLVIFLIFSLTIAVGSGMFVGGDSMIAAYNESFEKYHVEDGYFEVGEKLSSDDISGLEKKDDLRLFENFYHDEVLNNGDTLRIFKNREGINEACVMEGRLPKDDGEIAVDRMYADNNNLHVGSTINGKHGAYTVTGLIALSDYSALFRDNNDTMFDALNFGVSVVTPSFWDTLFSGDKISYRYSWLYSRRPGNDQQAASLDDDLMSDVYDAAPSLTTYVPQYSNQAIQFTGEDFSSDQAGFEVMVYILVAILAFVFAITSSNTIDRESGEIGTLRAMGYTVDELIRHYMTLPLAVTAVSAAAGNILGYTVFKNMVVALYYNSYSLPTYHTLWNAKAFIMTTLIPMVLMFVINAVILRRKLRRPPLAFIRGETGTASGKKAVKLNHKIPFVQRFGIRILRQNRSSYILLLIGILLSNFIAIFGLMFPEILDTYESRIENNMLAKHVYVLNASPGVLNGDLSAVREYIQNVKTNTRDAEKFIAYSLETTKGYQEDVDIYGIEPKSQYVHLDLSDNDVYISSAYAEKYGLKAGDIVTLKEKYEDKTYDFNISGIYDYEGSLAIFMSRDACAKRFDLGDELSSDLDSGSSSEMNLFSSLDPSKIKITIFGETYDLGESLGLSDFEYFSGYFSNSGITDIDEKYIAQDIDIDTLTAAARQLRHSMGSFTNVMTYCSFAVYVVLIYLLTKLIIEKNAHSISLTKIFGFRNGEITGLYLLPTGAAVILIQLITIPLDNFLMKIVWRKVIVSMMAGWMPYIVDVGRLVRLGLIGFGLFFLVAGLEYFRIRKIPMEEALKNAE